jgi:ADP-glucose pyrophosphorylase
MRDYLATSLALAGSSPAGSLVGSRTEVAADAQLDRTVLWDDVVVESDVRLRQCVVADGVRVPRGLKMERVALVRADQVPAAVRGARNGGVVIEPIA